MIDWLKYFPLQLRDGKKTDSVKGPSFSRARPVTLKFYDNIIRLRAPRHRSTTGYNPVYVTGMKAQTAYNFRTLRGATENWKHSILLYRSWDYWREWFGGESGSLGIDVSLLTRAEGKAFEGSSFFHPGAFESAIANFLNTTNGIHETGTEFTEQAPVNWQVHHHLPVFSCSFELWQRGHISLLYFVFPITDQHLGVISFNFTVSNEEAQARELVSQIINSVKLELSPESQAQYERVKQEIGELKLSEEFAPLKWPIKVEDIEQPPGSDALLSHPLS